MSPSVSPNKHFYTFLCIIALLSGRYLGPWAGLGAGIIILFPVVDGLLLILTAVTVRHFQRLSTEHPHKGESVRWSLVLSNPLPVITAPIRLELFPIPGETGNPGPDSLDSLSAGESRNFETYLPCRYRGVYNLGLKIIAITSPFGFWRLKLNISPTVIYVEPKIYPILNTKEDPGSSTDLPDVAAPQISSFPDQLIGIQEFQDGLPLSHIDWKATARLGTPMVRQFDSSTRSTTLIMLDTRQNPQVKPEIAIPAEDCGVETFFSILAAIRGTWEFHVPGWESGKNQAIGPLSRRSVGIFFSHHYQLTKLVETLVEKKQLSRFILVTPHADGALIEVSRMLTTAGLDHRIYCCSTGKITQDQAYRTMQRLVQNDINLSQRITLIQNPEDIPKRVIL